MCVNDIACAGGEPLFFLDYIACGKNYPEKIADIVKGVAEGCLQSEADVYKRQVEYRTDLERRFPCRRCSVPGRRPSRACDPERMS